MDILIVIVISIIFLSLIVLLIFRRTRRKKILIKELTDYAAENACIISDYDIWNSNRIGVDREKKYLFFMQKTDDSIYKSAININDVTVCKTNNVIRVVGDGKEKQSVIDKIILSISGKKEKADVNLEFYNSEKDGMQITEELQLAEKWAGIVNSLRQ